MRRSAPNVLWAGILLGTRLPFLRHGYGVDADAWRVAHTARNLIETGHYEPSRYPGYPVHEFVTALLIGGGPWLVNGVTAVLSVIAAWFFARYVERLGFRHAGSIAWALALTPTVFVSSVSAMDHVWALAFLMGALLHVQAGRNRTAGLLLGLAIGCRPTSAVMMLPLGILALRGRWRERDGWLAAARLAGMAALIGGLSFLPVLIHSRGVGFFTFYDHPRPLGRAIFNGTIGVWGMCGSLALALAYVIGLTQALRGARRSPRPRLPAHVVGAWATAIVIYGVGFSRVPFEPGYLIPAIPFVLLLSFWWLPDRAQDIVRVGLALSPFVLGLHKSDGLCQAAPTRASIEFRAAGERLTLDALRGPIVNDYVQRRNRAELVGNLLESIERLEEGSVVVAGWLATELQFASGLRGGHGSITPGARLQGLGRLDLRRRGEHEIVKHLSRTDWEQLQSEGRMVFYVPGSLHGPTGDPRERGADVVALGALPLPIAARSD